MTPGCAGLWRARALLACALLPFGRADPAAGAEPRATAPAAASPPNIVLILADDLGLGALGSHGGPAETPQLDRLAREGLELQQFYAAPLCTPSRAALLTGRSPVHTGLLYTVLRAWSRHGLRGREYTLAERLRDAGYQTALIGKWHLGHARSEYHPNLQGFDHFYGSLETNLDYFTHENIYRHGHDLQRNGEPVHEPGYLTRLVADEALRFVAERDHSRPFFLYLPFHAGHVPIQAPPETVERYRELGSFFTSSRAAMIDELDRAIGRVLAKLDQEGVRSNSIVVFLSDNGSNADPARPRLRGGKAQVFEAGIRVPALVSWPAGLPGGRVSRQRMRESDLFATLESAARLPRRAPDESRDLWATLKSGREEPREPFFFAVDRPDGSTQRAALHGRWKLVVRSQVPVETPGRGVRVDFTELYDLETDPLEQRNRSKAHPEIVGRLAPALRAWGALHPAGGLRLRRGAQPWHRPRGWRPAKDFTDYLRDPEVLAAQQAARTSPPAPAPADPDREARRRVEPLNAGRSPTSRGRRGPG